jgi:protein phosphatase
MGGHAGGEQASQTIIEVVSSRLGTLLEDGAVTREQIVASMIDTLVCANQELMQLARVDVTLEGMGAAVVVAAVWHNELLVISVGDSRAYLLRQNLLDQLTLDDTLVQGLVSAGALTVGEAARHPMRHVLLHSVGTRPLEKDLSVEGHKLRSGDRLLLTTDGLTDVMESEQLVATNMAQPHDPRAAATALVDAAQEAGARDNLTCIVVDFQE